MSLCLVKRKKCCVPAGLCRQACVPAGSALAGRLPCCVPAGSPRQAPLPAGSPLRQAPPAGSCLNFKDTAPGQLLRGVMTAELPTSVRRLPTRWQNPSHLLDVNDDGEISPIDVLILINEMNEPTLLDAFKHLPTVVPEEALRRFFDTNGDGFLTAVDVLRIINHLNEFNNSAAPESEAPQQVVELALLGLQAEQPSVTAPAPRRADSVRSTDRDAQALVFRSVANQATARDSRTASSDTKAADSDLALLEWLEQPSSDDAAQL